MKNWREYCYEQPSMAKNAMKLAGVILLTCAGMYVAGLFAAQLLPFLVAIAIASIWEPPVRFLKSRLHIHRSISASIAVALVTLLIGGLLAIVAVRLYVEIKNLIVQLPTIYNTIIADIEQYLAYIANEYDWVTPEVLSEFENLFARLREALLSLVNNVTRGVWNTAISAPMMMVAFLFMLFTVYFFLRDRERLGVWLDKQIPPRWITAFQSVRISLFHSMFAYIRAILLLALIAFVELVVGFAILDVDYGIAIALLCAVLDVLPVIGAGWVLTPWGAIALIMGDYRLGCGLLVLYMITWIVRQILEPRIVGGQLGIYPPLLLVAMYLGMRLFGVLGLIIGPFAAIVLRNFLTLYMNGRTLRQALYEGVETTPAPPAPEASPAKPVTPAKSGRHKRKNV